jgi:hypothetical protein
MSVVDEYLAASWDRTRGHLSRAWVELPAGDSDELAWYVEFLDYNELELAMEALEEAGRHRGASAAFWLALTDAAEEMRLPSKAAQYRRLSSPMKDPG